MKFSGRSSRGNNSNSNRDNSSGSSSSTSTNNLTPTPSGGGNGGLIHYRDMWYNIKFSHLQKLVNAEGRYECPRDHCNKHYKDASSLQRHIR